MYDYNQVYTYKYTVHGREAALPFFANIGTDKSTAQSDAIGEQF